MLKILMKDDLSIYMNGYDYVDIINNTKVIVSIKRDKLIVCGKDFFVEYLSDKEIMVKGKICELKWQ